MDAKEDRLARALLAARRAGGRTDGSEPMPTDRDAAYRVQAAVAAGWGAVGAWKTGPRPGGPPIMAPIFADRVRASPAAFAPGELDLIGVELEVAFRVTAPLPDPRAPDFARAARDCVAALPAIEVVDARIAAGPEGPPLLKLADNQVNGGLVCGPEADGFGPLSAMEAELTIGGEVVHRGPAEVPGGDAFEHFAAFARMVGRHCGGLAAGQVVATGSLTGLRFIGRGLPVHGRIEGLGEVRAEFPA